MDGLAKTVKSASRGRLRYPEIIIGEKAAAAVNLVRGYAVGCGVRNRLATHLVS